MKSIDKREGLRVEVRLKCRISAAPGTGPSLRAETENISRSGLSLIWSAGEPAPCVGELYTVEIELPANHRFGPKCIHCQGTVLRVSGSESPVTRVALQVSHMQVRDYVQKVAAFGNTPTPVRYWTT